MSHNSIYGLGESNTCYSSSIKMAKVKLKALYQFSSTWRDLKYFVDQINHNHKTPNLDLINNSKSKLIILVRHPNDTIQSIIQLTKTYYQPWSLDKAIDYYQERLSYLLEIIKNIPNSRYVVIDADSLVKEKIHSLNKLTKHLELIEPLTEKYSVFSFTGRHGDPSKNIREGRILTARKHDQLDANLDDCERLYSEIMKHLV